MVGHLKEKDISFEGGFIEGYARVYNVDYRWNLIGIDGKLLSEEWWHFCGNFHEGVAYVQRYLDNQYNWIDAEGRIISSRWFPWVSRFREGKAIVITSYDDVGAIYNYMDKDGHLLSAIGWRDAREFNEGFARVAIANGEWDWIDKNGKLVSEEWWGECGDFHNGRAECKDKMSVPHFMTDDGIPFRV